MLIYMIYDGEKKNMGKVKRKRRK